MGGNALQAEAVRLPASRYREVERSVVQTLKLHWPGRRIAAILAYADKPDFGDLDILIEGDARYDATALAHILHATEVVPNGDVTSIGLSVAEGVFQVDLICIPSASFDFAQRYFSHNDMGNLIGRVAHKFGAKFGHLGLLYQIRDPDKPSHLIEEVSITNDFSAALGLLGYDAARYEALRSGGGFRALDDIFKFVISTPYANREIYLLENRNYKSRTRDSKRATYNAFLVWLDEQRAGAMPAYSWGEPGSTVLEAQRAGFLQAAFEKLPQFRETYARAVRKYTRKRLAKQQFNGAAAAKATGLSGKALGELMARVAASFPNQEAFEDFFIGASQEAVRARFLAVAAGMETRIHRP